MSKSDVTSASDAPLGAISNENRQQRFTPQSSRPALVFRTAWRCMILAWIATIAYSVQPALAQGAQPVVPGGGKLTGDLQIATDYSCCKWQILPDGEYVVFAAGEKPSVIVHAVPIDASEPPRVLSRPLATRYTVEPYSISPNRKWILYESETNDPTSTELYVAPFAGGESTLLLSQVETQYTSFMYVPPGDSILLQEYYTPTAQSINFYVQHLPDGERRPIARFQSGLTHRLTASVSPDGRWLLVSIDANDNDLYELYVVAISDGNTQQLTASSKRGRWSAYIPYAYWTADSKHIVFQTHDGNPCRICAADMAAGKFTELDPTGAGALPDSIGSTPLSADGQYALIETNQSLQDPDMGTVVEKVEMHKVRIADGVAVNVTPVMPGETALEWAFFAPTGNALLLLFSGCIVTANGEDCTVSLIYSGADNAPLQTVPLPSLDDRYPGYDVASMGPGVVLQTIMQSHADEALAPHWVTAIYVIPFDHPRLVLAARFDYAGDVQATLSPDGKWLVYGNWNSAAAIETLYATHPGSGVAYRLATNISGFDITNKYVVYSSARDAAGMFDLFSTPLLDHLFLPIVAMP